MHYNDWKANNPGGTVSDYVKYCRENDERPDLGEADLSRANLSEADLSRANLGEADLSRANLSGADLSRANLSGANLSGADLSGANLSGADLRWANLRWASLSEADLSGANLSRADLSGASGLFTIGFFGRHHAVAAGGYISIGCERHDYEVWLRDYEDIGVRNEYDADEIADYGTWIKLAVDRQRRIEKAA